MMDETMMTGFQPSGASQVGAGEHGTLLLVDDDAPLRRSLQRALERRGFNVAAAESVKEGSSLAHTVKPDYAVIDLRLEDGSGIDLVKKLRDLHPRVRIVILTGYGNIGDGRGRHQGGVPSTTLRSRRMPTTSSRPCSARAQTFLHPLKTPCRPTACVGSTSSACSSNAIATFPKRHGA